MNYVNNKFQFNLIMSDKMQKVIRGVMRDHRIAVPYYTKLES